MNWISELELNIKKHRQILFSRDAKILQSLSLLLREQSHRVIVLWALELAEEILQEFEENNSKESRPRIAIEQTRLWASGDIKMPVAKRAILDCHAVAKELSSKEDTALVHAIGQACGTVHTAGHALGLPMYELTALVERCGLPSCISVIEQRVEEYKVKLIYWSKHVDEYTGKWAKFILK